MRTILYKCYTDEAEANRDVRAVKSVPGFEMAYVTTDTGAGCFYLVIPIPSDWKCL